MKLNLKPDVKPNPDPAQVNSVRPAPEVKLDIEFIRTPATELIRGVRTFYVESESSPGEAYVVKRVKRGVNPRIGTWWICSCQDWLHRKGPVGQPCKHILAVKAIIKRQFKYAIDRVPKGVIFRVKP